MAYETGQQLYHRVELEGRDKLTVSGVEDVERFDEGCIVMATCEGTLIVTGEGLHIGKLSLDGGELQVDGRVEALTYEEQQAPRGSWLTGHIILHPSPQPSSRVSQDPRGACCSS